MNILILGGTGYLGRKLTKEFVNKGHTVSWIVREKNKEELLNTYTILQLDYFLTNTVQIDILILAAGKYESANIKYEELAAANLFVPVQVLEKCLRYNIKRVISIGTSLPETLNTYSKTKYMLSKYGEFCCQRSYNNLQFCNIQLENFYGKDEPKDRFLARSVELMKRNAPIPLTEGKQTRDFIHIDDVTKAIAWIAEHYKNSGYHDIPVGTGENPSIREVIEYLKMLMMSSSDLQFGKIPYRKNEPCTVANIQKMKMYGLKPGRSWRDGMKIYREG